MPARSAEHRIIHRIAVLFIQRPGLKIEGADDRKIAAPLPGPLLTLPDQRGGNALPAERFIHPQPRDTRGFLLVDIQTAPADEVPFLIRHFIMGLFLLRVRFRRRGGVENLFGLFFNELGVVFRARPDLELHDRFLLKNRIDGNIIPDFILKIKKRTSFAPAGQGLNFGCISCGQTVLPVL